MLKRIPTPDADIFRTLLACFSGTPYVLGGSTPEGCDCSGSVCTALNVLYGTKCDQTADGLYRNCFTGTETGDGALCAVFFLTPGGKAVHVAGRMSDSYYMNVSRAEPEHQGTMRTWEQLESMYPQFRMELRSLAAGAWV
jgi:Cell wall-associated hydrolases (invasion-associated proteins)